ncbi:MAG: HAMP domain-containing histidine kinase [Ruminococcus sp.]|nr:HAMP domain-containing histidine kinase [Candidatus Copronaster equi]
MKKAKVLENVKHLVKNGDTSLPIPDYYEEAEYQEIIDGLAKKINELNIAFSEEKQDMQDWYTLWVHQIKTPIAVMKLNLTDNEKEISNQLFRIEEYVDMALSYIRLESEQNDLVIREYSLDELIRETVRKYAPQFIAKKIKLNYIPTDKKVITDKKWFSCILEQYISNAIKYTNSGSIMITVEGETLSVTDTGVGIAKEDLPRIFEKGYTGNNGRTDAKSSGLGLYLSAKAAKLICVDLSAESISGNGSRFNITFKNSNLF